MHDIIRSWRRLLDRYGDRMMVGEVYLLDPRAARAVLRRRARRAAAGVQFQLSVEPVGGGGVPRRASTRWKRCCRPARSRRTCSPATTPRATARASTSRRTAHARARIAALMLLTLRGTPFLYYGEEIGMRDGEIPPERSLRSGRQTLSRSLGRDPERTPDAMGCVARRRVQPHADRGCPSAADYEAVNAARQAADPASLLPSIGA